MPRINALNILLESDGKEYLAELYGKTIEGVQKALISGSMKNMDLSGDPVSGTVEAKRFVNATPKNYGTARTAGKGDAVKAKPVTVAIDTDREIVEELEQKDVRLYGVDGVLDRRSANHILRMAAELDNAFFAAAAGKATVLNLSAYKTISDELEAIIQECETTQNDFVDGVPRSMMHLVLSPKYYGMIRNDLDKQTNNANVNTAAEEFLVWHGVRAYSCVHLPAGCNYLLMVEGAVAQPIMADQYTAEKIPLSNAYGVELFYHYGTTVVMPDLIFKPGVFTKAATYAAGTQYYTEANGVYTAVSITEFASGTTYYTMARCKEDAMLFRNLKSGNIVAATDETSIELMQRSAIYEAVEIAPAVAPAPAKAEDKRRKKPTEAETDAPAEVQED